MRALLGSVLGLSLLAMTVACGRGSPGTVLVATTSTYDSGLLDRLLERYREQHPGRRVRAVAVGSGEALELGRRGDADLLLTHAPEAEREFVAEGHGRDRVPLMYNEFLLVGPPDDPAGVADAGTAVAALSAIARHRAPFLSRGDDSGTHRRERSLWEAGGLDPGNAAWYREAGQGQGETLRVASERGWYTLTDRATFATLAPTLRLRVLLQDDPDLVNVYSLIEVTNAADPEGAAHLAAWLTSAEGREAIARFGDREAEPALFTPLVVGRSLPSSPVPASSRERPRTGHPVPAGGLRSDTAAAGKASGG